jgi:predicted dinucleotide-binding enzyme
MRIGIIGAGSLGSALGERLGRAGHEIMFGGADSALEVAKRLRDAGRQPSFRSGESRSAW